MAVSIYCRMKKIIYCYATQKPKLKLNRKERARVLLAEWLCLPYPIREKQGCFLGYPVTGYAVEGFPGRKQKRTERTIKSLKKRIRKREMQESGT